MTGTAKESDYFSQQLAAVMAASVQADGSKWTDSALSTAVTTETTETVSHHYIAALRKGTKRNPRVSLVSALAHVLEVPVTVFLETEEPPVFAELGDPVASVQWVLLRELLVTASELSRDNQIALLRIARDLQATQPAGPT